MDNTTIATVISVILGISLVWGRASKIVSALKETADVLSAIANALGDQKITPVELTEIKREANEAIGAIKGILK